MNSKKLDICFKKLKRVLGIDQILQIENYVSLKYLAEKFETCERRDFNILREYGAIIKYSWKLEQRGYFYKEHFSFREKLKEIHGINIEIL